MNAIATELKRVGLEDKPSRLVYTEKYDPKLAPSATWAMSHLGMPWREILETIGLHTDQRANEFTLMERDKLIEAVAKIVHDNNITGMREYHEGRDGVTRPAPQTLQKLNIVWQDIQTKYKELYGNYIMEEGARINWRYVSDEDLLNASIAEFKDKKIMTLKDYDILRDKTKSPAYITLKRRFGNNRAELGKELHNKLGYDVLK